MSEFDLGPGLRLEERIDAAEGEGIEARWEFGRWMLTYVPEGRKKLPDGFLDRLCAATGKDERELQRRRQFAEQYPTREAIASCMTESRSWFSIVNELLPDRSSNGDVHYSSKTDEWSTPQDLFDQLDAEFGFDVDVCADTSNAKCANYFAPSDDGLAQDWTGTCWMNPPYGEVIGRWVEKARQSADAGAMVVCLVPARVDTGWWWDHCRYGEVRFLRGRLRFGGGDTGAPFPSAVVIFGREPCVKWWER